MPIRTIGYGLRDVDEFVALLGRYGVEYVGDVRSAPYSRRRPETTRDRASALALFGLTAGIASAGPG